MWLGPLPWCVRLPACLPMAHLPPCTPLLRLARYNLFVEMTAQIRRNVIYNVFMFKPTRVTQESVRARQQGTKFAERKEKEKEQKELAEASGKQKAKA